MRYHLGNLVDRDTLLYCMTRSRMRGRPKSLICHCLLVSNQPSQFSCEWTIARTRTITFRNSSSSRKCSLKSKVTRHGSEYINFLRKSGIRTHSTKRPKGSKNYTIRIDAHSSRQPLVKGERLMRFEASAAIIFPETFFCGAYVCL